MATDLVGTWNFLSSDKFDEFLKESGVGIMTRTVASKLKPQLIFTADGDNWTMTSISTFKTFTISWTIGKEFDDKTADGRDVTNLFTISGNKLIQEEKGKNGKNCRFERWVEDGKLNIVCECNHVKCVRVYERAAA